MLSEISEEDDVISMVSERAAAAKVAQRKNSLRLIHSKGPKFSQAKTTVEHQMQYIGNDPMILHQQPANLQDSNQAAALNEA